MWRHNLRRTKTDTSTTRRHSVQQFSRYKTKNYRLKRLFCTKPLSRFCRWMHIIKDNFSISGWKSLEFHSITYVSPATLSLYQTASLLASNAINRHLSDDGKWPVSCRLRSYTNISLFYAFSAFRQSLRLPGEVTASAAEMPGRRRVVLTCQSRLKSLWRRRDGTASWVRRSVVCNGTMELSGSVVCLSGYWVRYISVA